MGVPLLILVIGWGSAAQFSLLVFLVTLVALCEYFLIVFRERWKERTLGIVSGVLVSLGIVIPGISEPGLALAMAILLAFSICLFSGGKLEGRFQH